MRAKVKRYIPHIVVFSSSMGVMIIELLASRIISKYFGNSLYTWTGIIGIVLGGISLGNYLGGRLADRYPATRAAPVLLLIGSGLTLLMLVLDVLLGYAIENMVFGSPLIVVLAAVVVIFILFFLPSTALGTISPVMAKYALEQNVQIGSTVGSIYAAGAVGSIVGTFLSGFVLVPLLGIRTVVFVVAIMIALLTLFIRTPRRGTRTVFGVWMVGLAVLFGLTVFAPAKGLFAFSADPQVVYETDSMYSHISVEDRQDGERVLIMDGLIHNRYDRDNPDRLLYEYERIFEAATKELIAHEFDSGEIETLTLGGGALTFPTYLERHYPESHNEVVEIDPEVVEIAHQYFDVPRDTELDIIVRDARQYVRTVKNRKTYDLVYLDVFDSYSIPSHLTTREFLESIKTVVEPDGFLLVNLIDVFSIGKFLAAFTATVEDVFSHYSVYTSTNFSPQTRSTFVVLAGEEDPGLGTLSHQGNEKRRETFTVINAERITQLQKRNNSTPLTDNHAPVENLIAPVFLQAIR